MARMLPTVMPAAVASFCACMRASEIRSATEQICDCCNGSETCVPCTENDIVQGLLFLATFCCTVFSSVTVSANLDIETGTPKVHSNCCGGGFCGGGSTLKLCAVLTPAKLDNVMPAPCTAATTSFRDASSPVSTATEKTTWSACRLELRDALTITELESSCAKHSGAAIHSVIRA